MENATNEMVKRQEGDGAEAKQTGGENGRRRKEKS